MMMYTRLWMMYKMFSRSRETTTKSMAAGDDVNMNVGDFQDWATVTVNNDDVSMTNGGYEKTSVGVFGFCRNHAICFNKHIKHKW